MPGWLRAFATRRPLKLVMDTVRALFLGRPMGAEDWWAVAWLVTIIAVFAPLAVALYRRTTAR
jgi:ABC-type polysaccharide/polyol phosphate export permease